MKLRCTLTAVAVVMLMPVIGYAQQAPAAAQESLVITTGDGVVEVVPDRAWITIGAESRAANPREAQKRNADLMAPVQDQLRAARVPADAIRTVAYDLQQEFDFVNNRRVSRGYVARNSIEVRVDVVDRVGELLEIAVGSGATTVGGVRFDLKDRAKVEREALRLAVADARARADAAASGVGRTVDRVVKIDTVNMGGGPVPMPRLAVMREASPAEAPAISVGRMEIRMQVTLTASLK